MSWRVMVRPTRACRSLRLGLWPAPGGGRALCLLLPGLGDTLEKRAPVAERLAGAGHEVLSLDWCGQGGSGRLGRDPGAAHAASFDGLAEDVAEAAAARAAPGRPLWLLGYSMGATVGLMALGRGRIAAKGVALVSPMLRLPLPVPEGVARAAAGLAAGLGLGRSLAPGERGRAGPMGAMPSEAADPACRARVAALAAERPDLAVRGVTWGWAAAALRAMPEARAVRWREGPALVATATGERSVDLGPVPALARRMGAEVLAFEGGHDLFLAGAETRERLLAAILGLAERALAPRGAPG